jgi:small subunit ribosomal protein S17
VKRTRKYFAHDAENVCQIGDTVRIEETRPISKNKRWRIKTVLQEAVQV